MNATLYGLKGQLLRQGRNNFGTHNMRRHNSNPTRHFVGANLERVLKLGIYVCRAERYLL